MRCHKLSTPFIQGWSLRHFLFFCCCTFPFRDLVDWSVSTIYWVEDSKTQSQSIKEPTQTGSLESPVTCLSECGKKRTQIFHPHKPPCCPSKLDLWCYYGAAKKNWNQEWKTITYFNNCRTTCFNKCFNIRFCFPFFSFPFKVQVHYFCVFMRFLYHSVVYLLYSHPKNVIFGQSMCVLES